MTIAAWHGTGKLTCPRPRLAILILLLNQAHVQYKSGTEGSTVEKSAETHWLASDLVRASNSRSGGHEFEYPMRRELDSLTTSGKTFEVRSFYNSIQKIAINML
jgi:hypothetical protein